MHANTLISIASPAYPYREHSNTKYLNHAHVVSIAGKLSDWESKHPHTILILLMPSVARALNIRTPIEHTNGECQNTFKAAQPRKILWRVFKLPECMRIRVNSMIETPKEHYTYSVDSFMMHHRRPLYLVC